MNYGEHALLDRQRRILDLIVQDEYVSVSELSDLFRVSPSTIRNDLSFLEAKRLVERTHGGARSVDNKGMSGNLLTDPFLERTRFQADEKARTVSASAAIL